MKFIVFYLQLINSLEGLGMFFSSAALIRRLRKYTSTQTQTDTGGLQPKVCLSTSAFCNAVAALIRLEIERKS